MINDILLMIVVTIVGLCLIANIYVAVYVGYISLKQIIFGDKENKNE